MIEKEDELKKATAALQKYRTALQQGMSDSDYLRYLSDLGDQRKSSSEIPKYRPKSGTLTQSQHQEQMIYEHNNDVDVENIEKEASILKKIGNVIYAVIFWILSALYILLGILGFTEKGIASGIIFIICGLLINPKLDDVINSNDTVKIPKWLAIIILIVGFFAGGLTLPVATS